MLKKISMDQSEVDYLFVKRVIDNPDNKRFEDVEAIGKLIRLYRKKHGDNDFHRMLHFNASYIFS